MDTKSTSNSSKFKEQRHQVQLASFPTPLPQHRYVDASFRPPRSHRGMPRPDGILDGASSSSLASLRSVLATEASFLFVLLFFLRFLFRRIFFSFVSMWFSLLFVFLISCFFFQVFFPLEKRSKRPRYGNFLDFDDTTFRRSCPLTLITCVTLEWLQ